MSPKRHIEKSRMIAAQMNRDSQLYKVIDGLQACHTSVMISPEISLTAIQIGRLKAALGMTQRLIELGEKGREEWESPP